MKLSPDEQSRYLRHLLLSEIGKEGQLKLKGASVLCVGAGGLGSPALLYLAAAGVGRIGIVDPDRVDESNLQRQVLYDTHHVGEFKVEAAKKKLSALNPHIQIDISAERFEVKNAERLLSPYEAVMDGTDNFSTRYLVNDAALKFDKMNFFGCIFKFTGQVSVFGREKGCYRCLFPEPPPPDLTSDCATAGVLGVLPGLVGTYQALGFLKWKLELGTSLAGKLLTIDTLANSFRTLDFTKNPHCAACGNPAAIDLKDHKFSCAASSKSASFDEITVQDLRARLRDRAGFFLLDVREPLEYKIGNLGGNLIPLDAIATNENSLPEHKDGTIIVYCSGGTRSAKACEILRNRGYTRVFNVKGGMLAWKQEIDPTITV